VVDVQAIRRMLNFGACIGVVRSEIPHRNSGPNSVHVLANSARVAAHRGRFVALHFERLFRVEVPREHVAVQRSRPA
jgi:hypothetical protein